MRPRYPVYVISKGRWERPLTSRILTAEGVPHHVVIEPQERDEYARAVGADKLLLLPFSNLGRGSIPARNWVWDHAIGTGAERHWILDDNILDFYRYYRSMRVRCDAPIAFCTVEDFIDRYENVGIAGMNYVTWVRSSGTPDRGIPPFYLNTRVYSCILILNNLPQRWRGRYNEDTDLCLQVLAAGWCTVLVNAFLAQKIATMTMKGGNTESLYNGDGRLRMARDLERMWPGVVRTIRRFKRPQHYINWKRFHSPLRRKPGVVVPTEPNEYGMKLTQIADTVRSPRVRRLLEGKVIDVWQ